MNAGTITVLLGTVAPVVVGIVTKAHLDDRYKAFAMLVVTLLIELGRRVVDGGGVFDQTLLRDWLNLVVYTVASYYGFWKQVELPRLTMPSFGIGPAYPPEP